MQAERDAQLGSSMGVTGPQPKETGDSAFEAAPMLAELLDVWEF